MEDIFGGALSAVEKSKEIYNAISNDPPSFLDELPNLSVNYLPRSIMVKFGNLLNDVWDDVGAFSDFRFNLSSSRTTGDLFLDLFDSETETRVCSINMTQRSVLYELMETTAEPTKTLSEKDKNRLEEIKEELEELKPTKFEKFLSLLFTPSYRETIEKCLHSEVDTLAVKAQANKTDWENWNKANKYAKTVNKNLVEGLLPLFSAHGFTVKRGHRA